MKNFISNKSFAVVNKRMKILLFTTFVFFVSQNLTFADNYTEIPQEVIEYAYKKGYETPQRIWYLPNICIKNIIYTDTYYVQKKNNNKKYRYILYNKEHLRFATKSEQFKYLESGYF